MTKKNVRKKLEDKVYGNVLFEDGTMKDVLVHVVRADEDVRRIVFSKGWGSGKKKCTRSEFELENALLLFRGSSFNPDKLFENCGYLSGGVYGKTIKLLYEKGYIQTEDYF
jgi:hypothetical protein